MAERAAGPGCNNRGDKLPLVLQQGHCSTAGTCCRHKVSSGCGMPMAESSVEAQEVWGELPGSQK